MTHASLAEQVGKVGVEKGGGVAWVGKVGGGKWRGAGVRGEWGRGWGIGGVREVGVREGSRE